MIWSGARDAPSPRAERTPRPGSTVWTVGVGIAEPPAMTISTGGTGPRAVALGMLLLAWSFPAEAQWSGTPWSGVRYQERTDPGPRRVRALEIDLCDAGMTLRATRPAEANQTVSSWGSGVGVQAAINANMWHCGDLCGVGIGNGERFASEDDNHWGYLSFSLDGVDYPWDYETHPPPIWVEQAVGGHPRLVNAGAPMPSFAGNCLERHPRTSAGFNAARDKLVLAVVDGRSSTSVGATCAEMASIMVGLGAHEAINLDGGGSSTMWLSDRGVVNVPSDGSQRVVRNHLGLFSHAEGAPRHCVHHGALSVDAGRLRPLSREVSEAWGFTLLDLRSWPQEFIDAYERGPAVEPPRLIRADGDVAIYVVDRGWRRHVADPNSLRGWHLHHQPVDVLPAAEVDAIPLGRPLTRFPYLAVTPAHDVFLVDHPEPDPEPEPQLDAGLPDAGLSDAGLADDGGTVGPVPRLDAGAMADAMTSSEDRRSMLSSGCSATRDGPSGGLPAVASLLVLSLVLRRRA